MTRIRTLDEMRALHGQPVYLVKQIEDAEWMVPSYKFRVQYTNHAYVFDWMVGDLLSGKMHGINDVLLRIVSEDAPVCVWWSEAYRNVRPFSASVVDVKSYLEPIEGTHSAIFTTMDEARTQEALIKLVGESNDVSVSWERDESFWVSGSEFMSEQCKINEIIGARNMVGWSERGAR